MLMAAGVLALILGAVLVTRSFELFSYNHDVAWILYCAGEMLDGESLYRDIVEENPPLVFWLSTVPVAVARWLSLQPILVFNLMLGAVVWISCGWVYRIHRLAFSAATSSDRIALVALVASVEVLAPGYEFGQRENILLIAVFPYLFAAAAVASGFTLPRSLSLGVGVLAAFGFALKPYFLVLWLAIEFWLWCRARTNSLRPENFGIIAVLAAYVILVLVFSPEYLGMIELALGVYSAYGVFGSPALLFHVSVGLVVGAVALVVFTTPRLWDREIRISLVISAVSLLACALLQGKGWDYHYDPAAAVATVLVGVVLLGLGDVFSRTRVNVTRNVVLGLPLGLLLALNTWGFAVLGQTAWWAWGPPSTQRTVLGELVDVVRENAWRQPIWLMSTSVVPAFPLVNLSEARWSSRFCCLWLLPGLYSQQEKREVPFPYHDLGDMTPTERFLGDAVIEDLEKRPPQLLIVDRSPEKQAFRRSDFDYLRYFLRDPRFATFFQGYEELVDVGPFRVYRLKRLEGLAPSLR